MRLGIVELYCGSSGKRGFYNSQEIGLAKAMKKLGYNSTIFYPQKGLKSIEEEQVEDCIRIVYVPAKAFGVHSRYDWNILLEYRIQVVQLGSDNQLFAPDLIKYCDKHKIPLYSFIGTTESDSRNKIKNSFLKLAYRRNICVYRKHMCFVKTPIVAEKLVRYNISNVELAPVGLDTDIIPIITEKKIEIRNKLDIPLDKIVLLFVGRLDSYKRPIEVLNLLEQLGENVILIMIGTGTLDDVVTAEIKKRNISCRISRIKQILNKDIHQYFTACDYYINLNQHEIFGMSILEAMYNGCTVLACHAPGPDYIIEDKVSGYLVDDISDMKAIIYTKEILNQEVVRNRILSSFTWDRTALQFDTWIRNNNIK